MELFGHSSIEVLENLEKPLHAQRKGPRLRAEDEKSSPVGERYVRRVHFHWWWQSFFSATPCLAKYSTRSLQIISAWKPNLLMTGELGSNKCHRPAAICHCLQLRPLIHRAELKPGNDTYNNYTDPDRWVWNSQRSDCARLWSSSRAFQPNVSLPPRLYIFNLGERDS